MKGHIAFCPHFHQPHFQLYRTREEAFQNSYKPWLQMLAQAVQLDSFFINLHFSGPFLYWLSDTKPEFIDYFNTLLTSGKIGLLGGLADEPFIQLSSRNDDVLYQMKKYDELLSRVTEQPLGSGRVFIWWSASVEKCFYIKPPRQLELFRPSLSFTWMRRLFMLPILPIR